MTARGIIRVLLIGRGPSSILAALILGVGVVACELGFVDRGGSFVADNRSDIAVLVRIKSTISTGSGLTTAYEVVEVPPSSRLVIAYQSFSGPSIGRVDVLLGSCESIGSFTRFTTAGRVIRIDDGPMTAQVPEWPDETEPRAVTVDACPLPSTSPSP